MKERNNTVITAYEIIFNTIQERVYNGELSFEDGEILNEMAYDRYAEDDSAYEESTYEEYLDNMVDDIYNESTRFGKIFNKQNKNLNKPSKAAETILKLYEDEYYARFHELEKMSRDDPNYKIKKQQRDDALNKLAKKQKELNYGKADIFNSDESYRQAKEVADNVKRRQINDAIENLKKKKK